jgi:peptidoglycan-associated lipoprotein
MVSATIKQGLVLLCMLAIMTGCSSTSTQDQAGVEDTDGSDVTTGVSQDQGLNQTEEPEPEALATVFYFDFDQSILRPDARATLVAHAERLRASPRAVRLEGHADERGTREYNMALGERRANAVRDFLVLQGVDSALLEPISYGEERPAALGSDESSWGKNRRVELK